MKPKPAPYAFEPVPRLWPGETVVCLASGPSLTPEIAASVRGRARVIAIKAQIFKTAPWADVLYACDAKWWRQYAKDLHAFTGPRYSLDPASAEWARVLKHTGEMGFDPDPSCLRTGRNSGYQAIHLAVHLGASRIVLLGYDMQKDQVTGRHHNHADYPWKTVPPYDVFLPLFDTIVDPLKKLGVTVVNATPNSKLTTFPRMSLDQALAEQVAA